MEAPLAEHIRTRLASYLAGDHTLEEFEDWFVPNALSRVEEMGDRDLDGLIYEIELRLSEFSHGDWSEGELKRLLQPVVGKQNIRR